MKVDHRLAWFQRQSSDCRDALLVVYRHLAEHPEISGFLAGGPPPTGTSFNILKEKGASYIQVVVSTDVSGNRGPPHDPPEGVHGIKVALLGPSGDPISLDEPGYEDGSYTVFGSTSYMKALPELVDEIRLLLPYAQGKKEIPEE